MRWILVLLIAARTVWAHAPTEGKACRACHEDKHFGEFAQDCAGCHTLDAWSPSTFDHAKAKYPLEGKHVATPCRGCHPSKTSFVVGGTACLDCHQGPHGGTCEQCHTANNWNAWKIASHAMPLTGAHQRTACAGCHPGIVDGKPAPKTRGGACRDCHADIHAGQFAQRCDGCHNTEAWRGPQPHRMPLTGAHAIACAKCHPQTTLRNGETATRYALGYRACKDCHANPHPKLHADCGGCHAPTTWAVTDGARGVKMDHDPTGFPLRGAHQTAACGACHQQSARPETACESCHRDPHQGRKDGGCAECHTTTAWHDTQTLDRHRATRLPLTGKHALIDCSACHKRQAERTWRDTPADCWACHGPDAKALPSHVPYGRACARCHSTISWAGALDPIVDRTAHPQFAIATGAHATTACSGCHVAPRVVRCDGCHATHPTQVSRATSACLGCHPRGARR